MQLFEKYMAERSGFHFYLCNLGNGENVLCSSKAIVMKHIHNEQGQQLYLFTNSQIMNLLTCDPESSLLNLINVEFAYHPDIAKEPHVQRIQTAPSFQHCKFQ